MGGYTGESVVSEKSATVVAQHLDRERYEVYPLHIYPGNWYLETEDGTQWPVDKNAFTVAMGSRESFPLMVFSNIIPRLTGGGMGNWAG